MSGVVILKKFVCIINLKLVGLRLISSTSLISTPNSSAVKANNINMMKYSRPLLATLLMSGGFFQLVAPVLAETAAGTAISNTATASYDDPGNPGTPINATSNEVKVIVAEVAGIDVSGSGITDLNGGTIAIGDKLEYNFTVTNVGNSPTTVHLPGQPTVTGPGTFDKLQYLDPTDLTGGPTGTWKDIPAAGVDILGVDPGEVIQVRAVVTVNNGTGSEIKVQLGNTPGDAANQPLVADGNPNNVNTTGGAPANGQRESSATQAVNIGAVVKNIALATVTETRTGVSDSATPANLSDDVISYGLGLKVASTDTTNSGITPSALAGSAITVGTTPATGVPVNRILVSSDIPDGTKLAEAATAPTGWKAVYTTTPTATNANDPTTVWATTFDPTAVYTRVGFITDTDAAVVAPGAEVTGLNFKLVTSGIAPAATTYQIDSMAQAFGTTAGGSPTAIVYDESGDQTPNNFDSATPITPAAPSSSPITTGVADPAFVVDTANDNSAVGSLAGEINQYKYTFTTAAANSLLNGPVGVPEAIGPTDTNNDFTNKSTTVPAGTSPTTAFDPAAAGFNNTVKNTGTTAADISLLPELLAGDPLPVGTEVKISANGQEAIYIATATGFTFKPGSGVGSNADGPISATNPVTLDAVAPGTTAAYQVSVDLAQDATTKPLESFPVVINAFTGGTVTAPAGGDIALATPTATNKTIDRVYTGFVKLTKETRILQGTGPAVQGADSTFSTTDKKPASGNIIEYRITYENISDKLVGTGSSVMKAANLVITENGTTGTNTWAKDTDSNGALDTSNVVGSAVDPDTTSTIGLFKDPTGGTTSVDQSGTTAGTDITKYVDTVTTVVAPGGTGTFSFKRKLN